ncbi:MAG: S41 family peptidase [Bacteroidales bacterium]|nr:S41 family peptidase [Bacteroidales bacterium]
MKRNVFAIVLSALLISSFNMMGASSVKPLWLRDVQISPDGTSIAFCYKGDIWTVPVSGGTACRLTSLEGYDSNPVWSPDGTRIAFASRRNGGNDVYVMSSEGGDATRLTFNSASEIPSAFSTDGGSVLFSASIQDPASSALFPTSSMTELYSVPVTGGRTVQVLGTPAEMLCLSKSGDFFLYQDQKGFEDEWRKHHTSSITRDIWRYDFKSGRHTNLTNRSGEDRNPVLGPDGNSVYFLSEVASHTMNVWEMPLSGTSNPEGKPEQAGVVPAGWKQVSSFEVHPVRFLSIGGGLLCYTWDGEIYTQKPGSAPVKVDIDLTLDGENHIERMPLSGGSSDASVSPDGSQIAFVVRGEVFVTSVKYRTTKQITHTAAAEKNVSFGADNRSVIYASERDGISQLYIATIGRDDDPDFPNATVIDEKPFLPDLSIERSSPKFSPDGKEVAFVQDRTKLMVANVKTHRVREVTDGSTWYSQSYPFEFEWSPDGKWFTVEFTANGHEPYNDVGIVSADGGGITNITSSGYMSGGARWALGGNAILFQSEIFGMRAHASWGSQMDAFLCFVNQDAYDRYRLSKEDYELLKASDKKAAKADTTNSPKKIAVELEGISDRIVRLTPNSSNLGDAILSPDGESLYYLSSFEGGLDLWKMSLRSRETRLVSKGAGGGRFAAAGNSIFLLGSGLKKLDGDSFTGIPVSGEYKVDHVAEREYMYDYVCREEFRRFYTADMNGVDWNAMTAAYRKFLPHISNNADFAELLSELLGELNVSHTGGRFRAPAAEDATASLGLLYDLEYRGPGLKVAEIVKDGPFDHASLKLKAGDVITGINGTDITDGQDASVLLAGLAGKKTLVKTGNGKEYVVVPVSASVMSSLLYRRWVKQRAADVEKWSGGRLGYVHIESMDDGSFRPVYSDVLGKFNKCDGIVIDTRFNGGGRMHEDIEILFSGHKYLTQVIRGRESCDMPSRRWNKPSIMLQCESNYSNAHGTPWVYSHEKLGKLVGAPVPGTMTSVNWVTLQDPSLIFGIPVIGYRTAEGNYLEGTQLEPDVYVLNRPESIAKGEDLQLKAAVEELLKEIDSATSL